MEPETKSGGGGHGSSSSSSHAAAPPPGKRISARDANDLRTAQRQVPTRRAPSRAQRQPQARSGGSFDEGSHPRDATGKFATSGSSRQRQGTQRRSRSRSGGAALLASLGYDAQGNPIGGNPWSGLAHAGMSQPAATKPKKGTSAGSRSSQGKQPSAEELNEYLTQMEEYLDKLKKQVEKMLRARNKPASRSKTPETTNKPKAEPAERRLDK